MIMHNSPKRCNHNFCFFSLRLRGEFRWQDRITFRDRSYYFAWGRSDSILCSNTMTRSSSSPALFVFKVT